MEHGHLRSEPVQEATGWAPARRGWERSRRKGSAPWASGPGLAPGPGVHTVEYSSSGVSVASVLPTWFCFCFVLFSM